MPARLRTFQPLYVYFDDQDTEINEVTDRGVLAVILDENERPMVPIHECWSDSEGTIVVSVLREQGVEARLNSEVPHTVMPLTAAGLGKVEVLVSEGDAERAREILEEYEGGSEG